MNKERDYFFDNLKAVLIFLVVLGHFLLPIHGESVLVVVKRLIYVFHMPLFVFVSGYFAKKIYKNGQYNFKKILYLRRTSYLLLQFRRYMHCVDSGISQRLIFSRRVGHRGICLP